jgi:hypothetical protein
MQHVMCASAGECTGLAAIYLSVALSVDTDISIRK